MAADTLDATMPIDSICNRDVWCLFGLPVDNLTRESAITWIREKKFGNGPAVLSTVNVNWLVKSLKNNEFKAAVLNSDIVTIDGKPLLWLARLLGFPMREVVAGSSLIQDLLENRQQAEPLTIFLFGGEEGVAEQAMQTINSKPESGLRAVGALFPGFVSVERMSSPEIIAAINETNPDILLVALGAEKGTQWIERNRAKLNAGVISHLGATINFLAGTVQRAPATMQQVGLEWLWRVFQEPRLAKRYLYDGIVLLRFLLLRSPQLLSYLWLKKQLPGLAQQDACQEIATDHEVTIRFGKYLTSSAVAPLRNIFQRRSSTSKSLSLDFRETTFLDGSAMGLLLLTFHHHDATDQPPLLLHMSPHIKWLFHLFNLPPRTKG